MPDIAQPSKEQQPAAGPVSNANGKTPQKRGPPLHEIYSRPIPIRTFPLPVFYPANPISLLHIAYEWLRQVIKPPAAEPAIVHHGVWSAATSSIHVTDDKCVRALWEQGFYGKGNLSRSEPNWLKREQVRKGLQNAHVSEIHTQQRRDERAKAKWERARQEQEAIRQIRLEEAEAAKARAAAKLEKKASPVPKKEATPVPEEQTTPVSEHKAPVGPLELLALPNSSADLASQPKHIRGNEVTRAAVKTAPQVLLVPQYKAPVGPLEILALPNSNIDLLGIQSTYIHGDESDELSSDEMANPLLISMNGQPGSSSDTLQTDLNDAWLSDTVDGPKDKFVEALRTGTKSIDLPTPMTPGAEHGPLKRQKSVRFSPKVESTTFQLLDPPSPNHSAADSKATRPVMNGHSKVDALDVPTSIPLAQTNENGSSGNGDAIINKEHLQLTPEEAFFLSFGVGALAVTDPLSGQTLSNEELLRLFRQHSYFRPRDGPDDPELQPDDDFLIQYAVYHYFRSMGWVPRAGIKFGVDWLLYARGPVFDHAEFGLIVIPCYSDLWWASSGKQTPRKSWSWLHSIVRVLSHVTKSLVLIYVDVPSPPAFNSAMEKGFAEALKQYEVREVMVKRWSSNRNRGTSKPKGK